MKTTGRANPFDVVNEDPSDPFLKDLREDLQKLGDISLFSKVQSKDIKIDMLNEIIKTM